MPSALATPPRPPREITLPAPVGDGLEPFSNRMKSCSVVTYSEETLYRLPWSTLRPRSGRRGAGASASKSQLPIAGTFERALFRALEWVAIDQSLALGVPFKNPLVVHPRDLCERLCWRATQPQFLAIEKALETLTRIPFPGVAGPGAPGLLRSAVPATPRSGAKFPICPNFIVRFDDRFVSAVNDGRVSTWTP